ncbi:MAG: response regulator [Polyangiaceae bacterium]
MIALGHTPRTPARAAFARDTARFKDTRVLVVEDNKINREIATVLLQKLGIEVITASDGAEALALFTALERRRDERPIDLVLMDVQMPEMDGLTATREIRKLPLFAADKLPILAMTAHAMSGDRQRSLEAGMNDHLTKPVDPQELTSALLRWLPSSKVETAARTPQTAERASNEDIDLLTALKNVGGDRELLRELFSTFVDDYAEATQKLKTLVERGAYREASMLAHSIKGAGRTLGLASVGEAAETLERAMKDGRSPEPADIASFDEHLGRTLLFIRDLLAREENG